MHEKSYSPHLRIEGEHSRRHRVHVGAISFISKFGELKWAGNIAEAHLISSLNASVRLLDLKIRGRVPVTAEEQHIRISVHAINQLLQTFGVQYIQGLNMEVNMGHAAIQQRLKEGPLQVPITVSFIQPSQYPISMYRAVVDLKTYNMILSYVSLAAGELHTLCILLIFS